MGAADIGEVHRVGIGNPQTIVGGNVDDRITAGQGWLHRIRPDQIALANLTANPFEILQIARFAHQQAQFRSRGRQGLRHVVTDETGCACEKDPNPKPPVPKRFLFRPQLCARGIS